MSEGEQAVSSTSPRSFKANTGISLGLGLTSACNLKCGFCYRDPNRTDHLLLHQVESVMECLRVRSVGYCSRFVKTERARYFLLRVDPLV
jgi:MoaA/NifB/PqqE/SkfB family radical SAM enzyme